MHLRGVVVLVTTLGVSLSGCADVHQISAEEVVLGDGGYALVSVSVPTGHDADITFTFEGGGPGESFAVFTEPDDQPWHTGWFDMSPWMAACERDPSTSPCLDVHGQNAGAFVGVSRRSDRPASVGFHHTCDDKNDKEDPCLAYYALVAGERGPDRNLRVVVDVRGTGHSHHATIHQIR